MNHTSMLLKIVQEIHELKTAKDLFYKKRAHRKTFYKNFDLFTNDALLRKGFWKPDICTTYAWLSESVQHFNFRCGIQTKLLIKMWYVMFLSYTLPKLSNNRYQKLLNSYFQGNFSISWISLKMYSYYIVISGWAFKLNYWSKCSMLCFFHNYSTYLSYQIIVKGNC